VSANVYEREARASKLAKLIDAADRETTRGGLHPFHHAREIAEAGGRATPAHFARLAVLAGVRPPSPVTIAEFLGAMQHRAEARGAA
jgi:hypothetical protein